MLKTLDVLRSFAVKKKGIITGAFVFGVLSTGCSVIIPLFIGQFYNIALHSGSARGRIFESVFGHIENIQTFFAFFAGFLSIRFVFNFFEKYFSGITGEAFSNDLRKQLFHKQLHTELSTFESRDSGAYLLRYSGDLKATQDYLTKGIIQFLYDCVFMVAACTLLLLLNRELTIVLLCTLPILFVINKLMNKKIRTITRTRRNIRSRNLAFVAARLKAIQTVKLFNRESIESEKYNKRSEVLFTEGKKYYFFYAFMQALYPYLLYVALLVMLWVAYNSFNEAGSGVDGSSLITFIMLVMSIIPVYRRLLKVNMIWISGNVSMSKLIGLLNAPEENKAKESGSQQLKGKIIFDSVTFRYNDKIVLKNKSFEINPGEIVLLEGEQGSGKSTIFKLLTGLYPLHSGEIKIDGKSIKDISKYTLRKNIAVVSDNLPLLGKTVFEVISYSRKDKKRKPAAALLRALGFEGANDDVLLNKQVLDGGRNLSAGERKLLAIARAFLTDKKIMLLDEPFNDLENTSRIKVVSYIESMKGKHTFIVVDNNKINISYDKHISLQAEQA